MEYYYCTKLVRFPIKDVVLKIYNFFNESKSSLINLTDIYEYLADSFGVKSFNRANLAKLLNSQGDVDLNTVKDLYVKYAVGNEEDSKIDFSILEKVLLNEKIIESVEYLGMEIIKDILQNGPQKYLNVASNLSGEENTIDVSINENHKLIYTFIENFTEESLLELLRNKERLSEEINIFKIKEEKNHGIEVFINKLNFCLENVHADNMTLKVKYLFAGTLSQFLSDSSIDTVSDFRNLPVSVLQHLANYDEIILSKLKMLQFSIKQKYNEDFKMFVQQVNKQNKPNKLWGNYVTILENRAKGKTLEAAGQSFGVTRERVRQLEKKYLEDFALLYEKINSSTVPLRAMVENEYFIQDSDIIKNFSFNPLLYKYFLLNINDDNLEYSEELGKFYFIDDYRWYDDALRYTESLPEQIKELDVENYSTDLFIILKHRGAVIATDDCKKIIVSFYIKAGGIFSKNKMTLTEKYKLVWKEYFPEIINIYDNEFLSRFKKIYSKTFGDSKEYNDRSIVNLLARIGVLCGRGKYIINDRIFMSEELANEIYNYILDSGRQTFLTNTLFSIFNEQLVQEGISNKYFLQGSLRQRLGDKLYYKRDYVSTTPGNFNIYSDVLNYIKESKKVLNYEEIKNAFAGITDIILWMALSQDGVLWYRKKFVYIDCLNLTNEDIAYLKEVLTQLLSDNEIHHANQLLQYIKLSNNSLLKKCFVTEQFALFSIVQNLFESEFEFKRPFIANKNVVIGNQIERIKEYVYSKDLCTIDELLDYIYENQMHIYSILECINSLDEYVFKDETCIVPEDTTNINKYNVAVVEKLIEKEIERREFVFVDELRCFQFFPTEVKWTDWLLYSALNKYGTKYKVIASNKKFKQKGVMYAKPLIIKRDLGLNDIDELKAYLKTATGLNDTDFFVYLRNKGLA